MSTLNTESVFNLIGFSLDTCSLNANAYLVLYPETKIKSGKDREEREDKFLLFFTRLPYTTNPDMALSHSQGAFTNTMGLRTAHHPTREKTCQFPKSEDTPQ